MTTMNHHESSVSPTTFTCISTSSGVFIRYPPSLGEPVAPNVGRIRNQTDMAVDQMREKACSFLVSEKAEIKLLFEPLSRPTLGPQKRTIYRPAFPDHTTNYVRKG